MEQDKILLDAAMAAKAKLPEMEKEVSELRERIERMERKISQYRTIMAGADLDNEPTIPVSIEAYSGGEDDKPAKSQRGECMGYIDRVLSKNAAIQTKMVHQAILSKFQINFGMSTLYANLQRGLNEGRYLNDKGAWRMA